MLLDGYYLVDETGGAVSVNVSQTGTRALTSSAVASAVDRQGNAIANLIEQVQTTTANQQSLTMARAMGMGVPSPGGGDGGGSYSPDGITNSYVAPNYGTNLWLQITNVAAASVNLFLSNTVGGVEYEIQGLSDLTQTNWVSEGFVPGSELTNWTASSVATFLPTTNLFLRIRSWADDGSGLPIWWQLQYFGHVGVDPYGDPEGDGWDNLQKYQKGWNPNIFYTPPAPQILAATINPTNSVVTVTWLPAAGAVTGYTIGRFDYATWSWTYFYVGLTNQFTDTGYPPFTAIDVDQTQPSSYTVQADYAGGNSVMGDFVSPYSATAVPTVQSTPGPLGTLVLLVSHIPAGVSMLQLSRSDVNYSPGYQITETITNYPVSNFTNGTITVPASLNSAPMGSGGSVYYLQAFWPNGTSSAPVGAGYPSYPYYNGQTQLEQNVSFLLRAAGLNNVFSYSFDGYEFNQPTNYTYASYYTEDWFSGSGLGDREEFITGLPFTDNYQYRNFLPESTTNLDWNGFLNTGCSIIADGNFFLSTTPTFLYPTPTNTQPVPALDQSTFMEPYEYYEDLGMYVDDSGNLRLPNNIYNWFGLHLTSVLIAQNPENQYTLSAGGYWAETNITGSCYFYPQFDTPVFQTVGYYFGKIDVDDSLGLVGDPLPGDYDFSPTNALPLLITGMEQTRTVAGFTKKIVTNGDTTKPAYVAQYFSNAYAVDANGHTTTNPTGILSPYGDFFPTQPGPATLVTLPDIDTGLSGTCTVYAVSLQLDANHDGSMDLSYAGADATSKTRPMKFWVNNDHDFSSGSGDGWVGHDVPVGPNSPWNGFVDNSIVDYQGQYIECHRDLEDFARLWICGMPALTNAGYQVTLSWNVSSGSPAVNLVNSVETNGGTGYLTDTNVAKAQVDPTVYGYPGYKFAHVSPSQPYTFPANYFTNNATKHLLFEGSGIGSGELVLTIYRNSNVIAQTGAWLDLHDVKDFFEEAYATNVTSGKPPSSLVSGFSVIQTATSPAPDETKQIIVFVHGINNTETDYETTTRTIFKRLYWAGYHGRFASFRWPCAYLPPTSANPFQYNLGEFYAFKSATALKNYLGYLRNNRPDLAGYAIDLYAHSQGNVVTSEAILQGAPFDNYILTQGAFPAHCYDTNAPFLQQLLDAETNSVNAVQTPFYPVDGGYHGYCSSIHGNLIDFYNTNDFALATGTTLGLQTNWKEDQRTQKPEAFIGGPSYIYDPSTRVTTGYYTFGSSYTVTDLQEIKALVARSRSAAVGAQGGLHGAISGSVNLYGNYGCGNTRDEHSAQFARPIQTCLPYYRQMLTSFQIVTP